jgi:hypothetical protein
MSLVSITDVQVLDNPSTFLNPFQFEITFECIRDLREGTSLAHTHSPLPTAKTAQKRKNLFPLLTLTLSLSLPYASQISNGK